MARLLEANSSMDQQYLMSVIQIIILLEEVIAKRVDMMKHGVVVNRCVFVRFNVALSYELSYF